MYIYIKHTIKIIEEINYFVWRVKILQLINMKQKAFPHNMIISVKQDI